MSLDCRLEVSTKQTAHFQLGFRRLLLDSHGIERALVTEGTKLSKVASKHAKIDKI